MFENYLSTHFGYNTDLSNAKLVREYRSFEKNLGTYISHDSRKILEIGFGTGYFIKYLLEKQCDNFDAIEISKDAHQFVYNNISSNVTLVEDTSIFLKSHIGAYDNIFMFDVLEHIPKIDIVDFLKDISRSLQDQGRLFIRVPNAGNPLNSQILYDDFTHEVNFTGASLKQVCSLAGFNKIVVSPWIEEDISWTSILTNKSAYVMRYLLYIIMGLFRVYFDPHNPLSRNLFCVCSK